MSMKNFITPYVKNTGKLTGLSILLVLAWPLNSAQAAVRAGSEQTEKLPGVGAQEDNEQVRRWNRFADALYALHKKNISQTRVEVKETIETYGGLLAKGREYRTLRYFDKKSGRLLSLVQWKPSEEPRLMVIEVYQYDESGHLERDYAAAYLPIYHNAPFQTLINVHHHDGTLRAYRQFDASGRRIYEQCKGTLEGKKFYISLEDYNIPRSEYEQEQIKPEGAYLSCFSFLPNHIDAEIEELLSLVPDGKYRSAATTDEVESIVAQLTKKIDDSPADPALYVQRGEAYNRIYQFESAIRDFDQAIKLDDSTDAAYFGRGMALGRIGKVQEGIDDLTVFIARNPTSSLAYTKRGVRYLWLGDDASAKRDLENAILLEPKNAEAHDDLGVILARGGQYEKAEQHFKATINFEPSYQKAYHNLALVYYLTGKLPQALITVDHALEVQSNSRESILLKSEILTGLGREKEARALKEEASYLPTINWTEQLSVQ